MVNYLAEHERTSDLIASCADFRHQLCGEAVIERLKVRELMIVDSMDQTRIDLAVSPEGPSIRLWPENGPFNAQFGLEEGMPYLDFLHESFVRLGVGISSDGEPAISMWGGLEGPVLLLYADALQTGLRAEAGEGCTALNLFVNSEGASLIAGPSAHDPPRLALGIGEGAHPFIELSDGERRRMVAGLSLNDGSPGIALVGNEDDVFAEFSILEDHGPLLSMRTKEETLVQIGIPTLGIPRLTLKDSSRVAVLEVAPSNTHFTLGETSDPMRGVHFGLTPTAAALPYLSFEYQGKQRITAGLERGGWPIIEMRGGQKNASLGISVQDNDAPLLLLTQPDGKHRFVLGLDPTTYEPSLLVQDLNGKPRKVLYP